MSASNLRPYSKIAYTKVPDGEGGWTYIENSVGTIYLNVEIHAAGTSAICRIESVVTVKDLLRIDSGIYEVKKILRQDGGGTKFLELEKQDKPIEPVTEEAS